jgi:hypothetical protein
MFFGLLILFAQELFVEATLPMSMRRDPMDMDILLHILILPLILRLMEITDRLGLTMSHMLTRVRLIKMGLILGLHLPPITVPMFNIHLMVPDDLRM